MASPSTRPTSPAQTLSLGQAHLSSEIAGAAHARAIRAAVTLPPPLIPGAELAVRSSGLATIVEPHDGRPARYLDATFADPAAKEAFFQWVDRAGLVVCRGLLHNDHGYRPVGGKRSQRRLSQGEFFHHDGCSAPEPPRIVEIRCPPQTVVRSMATAIAPFPAVVASMLLVLSPGRRRHGGLDRYADAVSAGERPDAGWDHVQGLVNRVIRQLRAEDARAYFRDVDLHAGAFVEPWTFAESRFIANGNPVATMQHRRACHPPYRPGTPIGQLLKRWPCEGDAGEDADAPCARGACDRDDVA